MKKRGASRSNARQVNGDSEVSTAESSRNSTNLVLWKKSFKSRLIKPKRSRVLATPGAPAPDVPPKLTCNQPSSARQPRVVAQPCCRQAQTSCSQPTSSCCKQTQACCTQQTSSCSSKQPQACCTQSTSACCRQKSQSCPRKTPSYFHLPTTSTAEPVPGPTAEPTEPIAEQMEPAEPMNDNMDEISEEM